MKMLMIIVQTLQLMTAGYLSELIMTLFDDDDEWKMKKNVAWVRDSFEILVMLIKVLKWNQPISLGHILNKRLFYFYVNMYTFSLKTVSNDWY